MEQLLGARADLKPRGAMAGKEIVDEIGQRDMLARLGSALAVSGT